MVSNNENTIVTIQKETCPHAEICGGCVYQGVPFASQAKQKEGESLAAMKARNVVPNEYLGYEEAPCFYGYRNKMEYTFGDQILGGPMTLGMHMRGRFISVVDTPHCQIVPEDFNRILAATKAFCDEKGYSFYHKKRHTGLMRNLILRCGVRTKELLINIVTTSPDGCTGKTALQELSNSRNAQRRNIALPDPDAFDGITTFDESDYLKRILALQTDYTIVGVLHTFCDTIADDVKADRCIVLYGRDYYEEEIMGLKFKVSAFSFFQTNIAAVERLYSEAITLLGSTETEAKPQMDLRSEAELKSEAETTENRTESGKIGRSAADYLKGKRVFDLFCGTGTITQTLARYAKEVVGVEIVPDAVEVAKESTKRNGLTNCEFICGDVLDVLEEACNPEAGNSLTKKPDVIVVDPPRSGIHPKAWKNILNYGVKEILYISCSPKSLAQNLEHIDLLGYTVQKLKFYDNFPFTKHVETVVLMSKV